MEVVQRSVASRLKLLSEDSTLLAARLLLPVGSVSEAFYMLQAPAHNPGDTDTTSVRGVTMGGRGSSLNLPVNS